MNRGIKGSGGLPQKNFQILDPEFSIYSYSKHLWSMDVKLAALLAAKTEHGINSNKFPI